MVWARLPDRLHLELLPPVGGPVLIVDGGDGRLALTDPREGVAWVGTSDGRAMQRAIGVEVASDRLVAALLEGRDPGSGVSVERVGAPSPSLPRRLELRHADGLVELRIKRFRPLGADATDLGTGRPPSGVEVRPLDELPAGEPSGGMP